MLGQFSGLVGIAVLQPPPPRSDQHFLPRYSPDLNPIEQVFVKLKTLLRKPTRVRFETTWRGVGDLLDRFTPQECANYLANAGYAST